MGPKTSKLLPKPGVVRHKKRIPQNKVVKRYSRSQDDKFSEGETKLSIRPIEGPEVVSNDKQHGTTEAK